MNTVQNRLLAEGKTVPVARLCRWLGLPRSTAYYQPRTRDGLPPKKWRRFAQRWLVLV